MRILTSHWFCRTCKVPVPTVPQQSACRNRNHEVQADLPGSTVDEPLARQQSSLTPFERMSMLVLDAHARKISPDEFWLIQISAKDAAFIAESGYKGIVAQGGSWPHKSGNFADWNGYPIQVET